MKKIDARIGYVKDGEAIIKEDTWAYYAYILKDGKARILKNIDGKQIQIGTLSKEDIFGEMDFLGESVRTFSVVADGNVLVEMIAKDTFMELFHKLPRDTQAKLCAVANNLKNITEIHSRLIILLQNTEIGISFTKIAEMEVEQVPELMRHVVTATIGRHNKAIEGLNKLSSEIEEKQSKQLLSY